MATYTPFRSTRGKAFMSSFKRGSGDSGTKPTVQRKLWEEATSLSMLLEEMSIPAFSRDYVGKTYVDKPFEADDRKAKYAMNAVRSIANFFDAQTPRITTTGTRMRAAMIKRKFARILPQLIRENLDVENDIMELLYSTIEGNDNRTFLEAEEEGTYLAESFRLALRQAQGQNQSLQNYVSAGTYNEDAAQFIKVIETNIKANSALREYPFYLNVLFLNIDQCIHRYLLQFESSPARAMKDSMLERFKAHTPATSRADVAKYCTLVDDAVNEYLFVHAITSYPTLPVSPNIQHTLTYVCEINHNFTVDLQQFRNELLSHVLPVEHVLSIHREEKMEDVRKTLLSRMDIEVLTKRNRNSVTSLTNRSDHFARDCPKRRLITQ